MTYEEILDMINNSDIEQLQNIIQQLTQELNKR